MAREKMKDEGTKRPVRFKLKAKEPVFQVTREGPFAYHTFRHGEVYERVPVEDKHRFEIIGGGEEG